MWVWCSTIFVFQIKVPHYSCISVSLFLSYKPTLAYFFLVLCFILTMLIGQPPAFLHPFSHPPSLSYLSSPDRECHFDAVTNLLLMCWKSKCIKAASFPCTLQGIAIREKDTPHNSCAMCFRQFNDIPPRPGKRKRKRRNTNTENSILKQRWRKYSKISVKLKLFHYFPSSFSWGSTWRFPRDRHRKVAFLDDTSQNILGLGNCGEK